MIEKLFISPILATTEKSNNYNHKKINSKLYSSKIKDFFQI